MSATETFTICFEEDGAIWRLFKVIFGSDGSYYVTAPYHPHNTALLTVLTQTYTEPGGGPPIVKRVLSDDVLEVATLDEDDQRLKLAHHPDGFIQFSGEGITSGRNPDGTAKGLGLVSWKLARPTLGPSFGITFHNVSACGRLATAAKSNDLVFHAADLRHVRKPGFEDVAFQGYFCPPPWRQFLRSDGLGGYRIGIVNPGSQVVLDMPVILASLESELPGLIGFEVIPIASASTTLADAGYIMTSSTGRLRRSPEGNLQGDALVCMYPRPSDDAIRGRNLAFRLPAPPYAAAPGTTNLQPSESHVDSLTPAILEHLQEMLPPRTNPAPPVRKPAKPSNRRRKRRRR